MKGKALPKTSLSDYAAVWAGKRGTYHAREWTAWVAIVSRITHLHNGSVIARNQPNGGGLVVVVNIPIIEWID